jgi:hypothetical protein
MGETLLARPAHLGRGAQDSEAQLTETKRGAMNR